jgi:phosphinothricin acetyltransferase
MKPSTHTPITSATPDDYDAIASIYNEHISIGTATMEVVLQKAEDIKGWVTAFNDRERLYVIKKEGQTIGYGIIKRYSDRGGYRLTCETAVYLTEKECGKGYGSTLKKFLIAECKKLGYHHLVAKIFAGNAASIHYNEKLGYTIVGTQKEIGFKNGKWMDVVIMQLIL